MPSNKLEPLQQCAAIHTHSLLMVVVALPLALLWPQERRACRRFRHQLELRGVVAGGPPPAAASAAALAAARNELVEDSLWVLYAQLVTLYLVSGLVWAGARLAWAAPLG